MTIIQTMLRAFPPPPDCYLYSTTLCKARWRHGNADTTVIPSNARETIKQWTDVHGLSNAPSNQVPIEGYPRQVWLNGAGEEIVESYTITHMAHGTPLATGDADFECGAAGPFLLEVGISSSFHIAKFFGLTLNSARPMTSELPNHPAVSLRTPLAQPEFFYGKILDDATTEQIRPKSPRSRIDIGAVITRALESAGLRPRG